MRSLFLVAILFFAVLAQDAEYVMGTRDAPQEDLPFDGEVITQTIVRLCRFLPSHLVDDAGHVRGLR